MYKSSLNNGLFLGVAMVVCMFSLYFANVSMFFHSKVWVYFLVFILIILKSGREAKRQNGGQITFGSAFKNMFYTGAIGYFIVSVGEFMLYNFIDSNLIDIYREITIESLETMAELFNNELLLENMEAQIDKLEDSNPLSIGQLSMQLLSRLIAPVAFCSAIFALFIRTKNRDQHDNNNDDHPKYIMNNN